MDHEFIQPVFFTHQRKVYRLGICRRIDRLAGGLIADHPDQQGVGGQLIELETLIAVLIGGRPHSGPDPLDGGEGNPFICVLVPHGSLDNSGLSPDDPHAGQEKKTGKV
jgi:hypothetical protein